MIADNIRTLRSEKDMTQKELADYLHITSQAVSRWEKGETEPSLDAISKMAKIFGVTVDQIVGDLNDDAKAEKANPVAKVEEPVEAPPVKQVLAVCEQCKKPIYDGSDLVIVTHAHGGLRGSSRYYEKSHICAECDRENKEKQRRKTIERANLCRKKSFGWGGAIAAVVLIICIAIATHIDNLAAGIAISVILPITTFTFVSCLFLKNNFIEDIFLGVCSWGCVRFPGLIFSFSLEGFAWLIAMKILFVLIGFLLGVAAALFALVLCLTLSVFVYPFALRRSIVHPEKTEL